MTNECGMTEADDVDTWYRWEKDWRMTLILV